MAKHLKCLKALHGYRVLHFLYYNFNSFKNTVSSAILNTHNYILKHFPLNSLKSIVLYYVPSLQIPMSLSLDPSLSRTLQHSRYQIYKVITPLNIHFLWRQMVIYLYHLAQSKYTNFC